MNIRLFQAMAMMAMLWAATASWAASGNQPPVEGSALPEFTLPVPRDVAHQAYLGLAGKKQFAVADIPAEIVIVQIFNMY